MIQAQVKEKGLLYELTESYVPEEILFREEQIKIISGVFTTFKRLGVAKNIVIQGGHGSGKTATILKILKDVGNSGYLFASGSTNYTTYKLLRSLFNLDCNTLEKTMDEGIKKLRVDPKVLVVDEINKLKNNGEIHTLFNTLNTINRETDCPLIIITNISKLLLNEIIAKDSSGTLLPEVVDFPPYDQEQLKSIVLERVKIINGKNPSINFPEDSMAYLCALVKRDGDSSAREVRIVSMRCILENDFSQEHIRKSLKWVKQEDEVDFLNKTLGVTERKFLKALIEIKDFNEPITSSNFYKVLRDNSETLYKDMSVGPSRVSGIITTFENMGYLLTENINRGRSGGNVRKIILNSENLESISKFF